MFVLLVGHRRGISRSLEKLQIPFAIWNNKKILGRPQSDLTVIKAFPNQLRSLPRRLASYRKKITHVIAGTEESVWIADQIRKNLKLKKNSEVTVLRCLDKWQMKDFLLRKKIPMTEFIAGHKLKNPDKVFEILGKPLVAKERLSSGGRGFSKIETTAQLKTKLNESYILEKWIHAKEGSVESFIKNRKIIFQNITQYRVLGACNVMPAYEENHSLKKTILNLNRRVITALDIKNGMTHLEFYHKDGKVLFGEIALRPPGGYLMEALNLAYGRFFWDEFVKLKTYQKVSMPKSASSFAASYVLHPGEGKIKAIKGLSALKKITELKRFKLQVQVGDSIQVRKGVGESIGYALFQSSSAHELEKALLAFESHFKIVF